MSKRPESLTPTERAAIIAALVDSSATVDPAYRAWLARKLEERPDAFLREAIARRARAARI